MKPIIPFLALIATSSTALATPRIESNSALARHDLQLLRDHGSFNSPLITWPFPLGREAFLELPADSSQFLASYERITELYQSESQVGIRPFELTVAASADRLPFRSFGYQPRDNFESSIATSWLSKRTAGKLKLTGVGSPTDGDDFHLDGSFLSVALGNWAVGIDQVERWWGPGWDGSLVLSNNARPLPAISLNRIAPLPFESKWLNWLGPWTFSSFMGQMSNDEGERDGSNARLFGMRIELSPFGWQNLDIGMNRMIQWAGEGRPNGLDTFWKAIISEDNRVPGTDVTEETEPGNQLAGVDYRLRIPGFNIAQYGQMTAEDEDGFLPDAAVVLYGIETWGRLETLHASWRAYLEHADTETRYFLLGGPRPGRTLNIAYNHGIYQSQGYRDKDRALGHAIDSDSTMTSLGGFLAHDNGNLFGAKLRRYKINHDGTGQNFVSTDALDGYSLELTAEFALDQPPFSRQHPSAISQFRFKTGLHYYHEENLRTQTTESGIGGYLALTTPL